LFGLTEVEFAALRLSLSVALQAVAFSLPFALGIAWLLARTNFHGKFLLNALVHLPLVLPPVVVGYLLLLGFGIHGPFGSLLYNAFDIRLAFSTQGAALACAVMAFPLMVRAIRLSLEVINPKIEQAASTLGAGPFDRFVTITLPLMLPGILSGSLIAFAAALGEFGAVITFVSNIPGETQTLPLAIYSALQTPDGDLQAARLAVLSISLALAGLLVSEWMNMRLRKRLGLAM
jgi:molybdate transport system permease protein